jgi:hypothetical protein
MILLSTTDESVIFNYKKISDDGKTLNRDGRLLCYSLFEFIDFSAEEVNIARFYIAKNRSNIAIVVHVSDMYRSFYTSILADSELCKEGKIKSPSLPAVIKSLKLRNYQELKV